MCFIIQGESKVRINPVKPIVNFALVTKYNRPTTIIVITLNTYIVFIRTKRNTYVVYEYRNEGEN